MFFIMQCCCYAAYHYARLVAIVLLLASGIMDSLPEWSKGVDSSSTSASCVGSNPTAVNSHYILTFDVDYVDEA